MQNARPALVVSIHDVSPSTEKRVVSMLADLEEAGLKTTSLLVIPDHHHKAPLAKSPGCAAWLRSLTVEGPHEAVLHGYYHQRPPRKTGLVASLITEQYTAGEGEFFDLTQEEASAKLARGLADFAAAGLSSRGFIAPAWLLGEDAEAAVRDGGFLYTTRLGSCKNLVTGQVFASQSLVWSVRAAWRRWMSLAWNALLFNRLRKNSLMRIGLHPPDWDHPAIKAQILRKIRQALAGREAMTYDQWVERRLRLP